MKSRLVISFVSIMATCMFASHAMADRTDRRQVKQRARIHEGVKSGELTKGEAAGLRKGERHVRRMEKRAEADGNVTNMEAHEIEKAQDTMSKQIHEQKNDAQKAE